jgi:hypothetical protein
VGAILQEFNHGKSASSYICRRRTPFDKGPELMKPGKSRAAKFNIWDYIPGGIGPWWG